MLIFINETTYGMWEPPGRVVWAINGVDRSSVLDDILDLTAFRYSDFGRFLVCYAPPETVPETVKNLF